MTVTTNATNMELRHTLMEFIEKEGRDNIYKVTIVGYRNPDFDIDLEGLAQVGNVVSVMDRTEPDYDFEELYERNKDNLLGMFIKNISTRMFSLQYSRRPYTMGLRRYLRLWRTNNDNKRYSID